MDDDNEPAPENSEATEPNPGNGWFEKPTMCPRRMANINNMKGKFNSHHWEVIAEMNELDQFRLCFPEQFVIDVIIPETNKHLVWNSLDPPRVLCLARVHLFHGVFRRNRRSKRLVVDGSDRPVQGGSISCERVHVKESLH